MTIIHLINSVQEASLEGLNHAAGVLYIIYINGHLSLFSQHYSYKQLKTVCFSV